LATNRLNPPASYRGWAFLLKGNIFMKIEEQLHIASLGAGKPIHLVDIAAIEKNTAERNKQWAEANQPKSEPEHELKRLVQKHYDLKRGCHHTENVLNEACGQLHLCEERIKDTEKLLTKCESPLGQANYEAALRRMRTIEHVDLQNAVKRARRNNSEALAALRTFEADQLPRIEQLRKEVGKK
jgi:hypothetical protein